MEILVLEHGQESYVCLLGVWARQRGHSLKLLDARKLTDWPDPDTVDAIVSLGADESVHASEERWIAEEVNFLRTAHEADVPVLGICFGAQALAAALGGAVTRAPSVQIGWGLLELNDPELVPAGPWFRWHEDVFSMPPGAHELARSPVGPDAFELGRSIGLQFHPEVDEAVVHKWIADAHSNLIELPVDEETLMDEVAAGANGAAARAGELFDRIEARWASAYKTRGSNGG